MSHFRVYETLCLCHYVEANSVEDAKKKVEAHGPLNPPKDFDTEVTMATVMDAEQYDPEG